MIFFILTILGASVGQFFGHPILGGIAGFLLSIAIKFEINFSDIFDVFD